MLALVFNAGPTLCNLNQHHACCLVQNLRPSIDAGVAIDTRFSSGMISMFWGRLILKPICVGLKDPSPSNFLTDWAEFLGCVDALLSGADADRELFPAPHRSVLGSK